MSGDAPLHLPVQECSTGNTAEATAFLYGVIVGVVLGAIMLHGLLLMAVAPVGW